MAKKTNKAEVDIRVKQIYKLIVNGYTTTDIIDYCSKNYNVCKATACKYISKATEKIKDNNSKIIDEIRAEETTRYYDSIQEVNQRIMLLKEKAENGTLKNYESDIAKYIKIKNEIQARIDKINGLEVQEIKLTTSYDNETKDLLFQILKNNNDKE